MKEKRFLKELRFFNRAKDLDSYLKKQFENPRDAHARRFVWDYWHVPDQYTLLRTPAFQYFPSKIYRELHESLVHWGRTHLGCHDISPPWLSIYVEGCSQDLHGDLPHGPWAFVYSLTDWKNRSFSGGQTLLMHENILDHWNSPLSQRGMEKEDILEEIEPAFNQLLVFDPRIPHGVKEVRGVSNPAKGRIVIHGWFIQPRPFISGSLTSRSVQKWIDGHSSKIQSWIQLYPNLQGVLTFRLTVSANGKIRKVTRMPSTLRSGSGPPSGTRILSTQIQKLFLASPLPASQGESEITLPLIFQAV